MQGIADANLNQVVVIVPSGGLAASVTSMSGQAIAAQVLVQNANPVNITNIAVDGTGGDQALLRRAPGWQEYSTALAPSGTIGKVRASGQMDEGCGVGIWAENAGGSKQHVTIQSSSVHDVDGADIFAGSGPTPALTATVRQFCLGTRGPWGGVQQRQP